MKKKGFLLAEETVKIIIALIVIGVLIYLLTSLYFSKVQGDKLKQANSILLNSTGSLQQQIYDLEKGKFESDKFEFVLNNPTGWYFFSFTGNNLPTKCGGQTCVCICDDTWFSSSQPGECHKNGACLVIPYLNPPKPDLEIYISSENPSTLEISKTGRLINIKEKGK